MKNGSILILCLLLVTLGCKSSKDKNYEQNDTPKQGTIHISVDESFKPVIEEQIRVYESSYPDAHIIPEYKSEADCFRDLQKDSTRMIIVARGLNNNEQQYYQSKLSYKPLFSAIAYDAVAVIVNAKSADSVFTVQQLKDIISGKKNTTAVMDGKNATSTVRFLQDSVLKGTAFGANVVAANGSEAVVDAISKNEHAIGFVGLSWVGNKYEAKQEAYEKTIRLALVECVKCDEKDVFAKPSQSTITFAQYPLARPLFYILKENSTGLGTGFANFMSLERGQLIFRRAFLAPAKMDFKVRKSSIKEEESDQ